MIRASTQLLLDTGIVIYLCRGGTSADRLDERYELLSRPHMPWISVVSAGELYAFAERNGWGRSRRETLESLLSNLVVVDINYDPIVQAYARFDAHLTKIGRRMGQQNDLWIAATAAATGAVILTTDLDFDKLAPGYVHREWVDPKSLT